VADPGEHRRLRFFNGSSASSSFETYIGRKADRTLDLDGILDRPNSWASRRRA
jgi:hypothetical protein